eukprot:snap_masked-scaffold_50-processed-gene-1.38-mRNA-1 protein AED:1.00 eAED:1.00 QI:0/0/0/0/1/1/2/0/148
MNYLSRTAPLFTPQIIFLYETTFVANEDKYGPFLSQNILVLDFGIFIYYGGVYQNYCFDLEYHPIVLCSRECCKKDLPAETNLALKYCRYRIHFFRHNIKLRKEKSTNNIFKKDSIYNICWQSEQIRVNKTVTSIIEKANYEYFEIFL